MRDVGILPLEHSVLYSLVVRLQDKHDTLMHFLHNRETLSLYRIYSFRAQIELPLTFLSPTPRPL